MINTDIDILIKKTGNLIENLDKYVSGMANQSVSMVEWLTLGSAIVAAVVSSISIYMTFRSDKKNRESNEKIAEEIQIAENKRAEATIYVILITKKIKRYKKCTIVKKMNMVLFLLKKSAKSIKYY